MSEADADDIGDAEEDVTIFKSASNSSYRHQGPSALADPLALPASSDAPRHQRRTSCVARHDTPNSRTPF
jgi:hypothetical protein